MQGSLTKTSRKDLELAKRIARGDRMAFAQFVDAHGPRIQALARRYARTNADAEDLTQEILLDLYKSIGSFRGGSAISTWVYRVALNHCIKHCERRKPAAQEYEEGMAGAKAGEASDPAGQAMIGELREKVEGALATLSPEHRDVVILHELQELTYSECASILRVPVGTVKSRLYYAFRSLRGSLAAYVLGEGSFNESAGNAPGQAAETIG